MSKSLWDKIFKKHKEECLKSLTLEAYYSLLKELEKCISQLS